MTDREAMKMALEAMERRNSVNYEYKVYLQDAIDVLRQALAQPEQNPVAWEKSYDIACALLRQAHDILAMTQYPIKRPWVSLTDEERNKLWKDVIGWGDPSHDEEDLMKAIEAALRSKNDPAFN